MTQFRSAKVSDLSDLNRISVASKKYWGYPDEWMENWAEDLFISAEDIDEHIVQIAEVEEEVVGFCSVSEEEEYLEIQHLWILPEFVAKGYGKELLTYTLGLVSHKGKPIQVVSDPNAEAFYKKQGFTTISNIESYPQGRSLPLMKKM